MWFGRTTITSVLFPITSHSSVLLLPVAFCIGLGLACVFVSWDLAKQFSLIETIHSFALFGKN